MAANFVPLLVYDPPPVSSASEPILKMVRKHKNNVKDRVLTSDNRIFRSSEATVADRTVQIQRRVNVACREWQDSKSSKVILSVARIQCITSNNQIDIYDGGCRVGQSYARL